MASLWPGDVSGGDELVRRRRIESLIWSTRWTLLTFGLFLILTLRDPPVWLSFAALAGGVLHNAVFRILLIARGSCTQLRLLGGALFLLDVLVLLIGIEPMFERGNHNVPLLLLVIPLEAIPRLGFERPSVSVTGMAILTLLIVLYILLNLRGMGWRVDATIWAGFYGLIGFWATFVSRARWQASQRTQTGFVISTAPISSITAPSAQKGTFPNPLTERQREVLRLVAAGKSTREIADTLSIGTETVHTHLRDIAKALGTRSRKDAVQIARERGYLD